MTSTFISILAGTSVAAFIAGLWFSERVLTWLLLVGILAMGVVSAAAKADASLDPFCNAGGIAVFFIVIGYTLRILSTNPPLKTHKKAH